VRNGETGGRNQLLKSAMNSFVASHDQNVGPHKGANGGGGSEEGELETQDRLKGGPTQHPIKSTLPILGDNGKRHNATKEYGEKK